MRLRQIEVFQAVYANGSISAAARSLHVSQPSVSKVLRHTEIQLGMRLFEIVKGRLVPTHEAHQLFKEVDEVYQKLNSLKQTAKNIKNAGAGRLNIGVVPSIGLEILPKAIASFRKKNKGVTFDIRSSHTNQILRGLVEREFDIAICYDPPFNPRVTSRKVASTELKIMAPKGIFPASNKALTLNDLKDHDYVSVTNSGPIGEVLSNAMKQENIELQEIVTVETYYIAAGLVQVGCGITIVDEYTIASMKNTSTAEFSLNPPLRLGVYVTWLEDVPLSVLTSKFIKTLEATFASNEKSQLGYNQ